MNDPLNSSIVHAAWMPYCEQTSAARLTLFCFHCAGSGASMFRCWRPYIPADIDLIPIQLPGRENRWQETPYQTMSPRVEDAVSALKPYLNKPFALFRHRMGALE